jgi:hypothetical protein
MRKIIHNLRRQPEEVRRHILHVLIFIAMIVMVALWVFSLGINFTDPDTKSKIEQDLAPFSVLKDNIVNGSENIEENN